MQAEPLTVSPQAADASNRRFFLDWLRIIAFFVLIVYHTGMYYVTWDYHIKSPFASDTVEPLMLLSSPWRLALLFMISGVASRFMLQKLTAGKFMRQRSFRLLLPLVFGMLVIVPPQAYLEGVHKFGYSGSYVDFMALYLKAFRGFCKADACLTLPTWNHLWFVAYLWVYTMLLGLLIWAMGSRFEAFSLRCGQIFVGWKIIVLPILALVTARLGLFGSFPSTHNLTWDWYNHAHYLPLFLLGALVAMQRPFWQQLDTWRWPVLGAALTCWAALTVYYHLPDNFFAPVQVNLWRDVQRVVFAACQWLAICAAFGFAHHHLEFDSARRRYLAQAVFPVYIFHQTILIILAHTLQPARIPPLQEGIVLIVMTLTLSLAGAEAVRRMAWLRPLFGLAR